jgi:uncharacterized glyoxalase superfamily protein PhnB
MPKIKKLTPNLMVKDIQETVKFYQEVLGFSLVMAVPETPNGMDSHLENGKKYVWAQVENGSIEIMFQEEKSFKEDIPVLSNISLGASASLYMEQEDIENFYASLQGKAEIIKELFTTWYGMKEFYVRDPNGYILCFGEAKE